MQVYLILSDSKFIPSEENLAKLKAKSDVQVIIHQGPVATLPQLQNDEVKVLGIDPDVTNWNLDAADFTQLKNVQAICAQSTSYDWLKPMVLKELGIAASNSPYFSTDAVAEYAICMAIEAARRTAMHLRKYEVDWSVPPMLLKGSRIGIVGLGHIGKRIAEIAQGIGMEIVYWSQHSRDDRFQYLELDELFATSDVVIPTLKENDQTKEIISNSLIDQLKVTAVMVGINRIREVYDEKYVIDKVTSGKLGGYAFEGDGVTDFREISGNIWSLPAMAWYTQESLQNLESIWIESILSHVEGKPINLVN